MSERRTFWNRVEWSALSRPAHRFQHEPADESVVPIASQASGSFPSWGLSHPLQDSSPWNPRRRFPACRSCNFKGPESARIFEKIRRADVFVHFAVPVSFSKLRRSMGGEGLRKTNRDSG
ncbi:hypothetical protein Y032_0050g1908 [Ancylostoma ceylanicum]|uniref:Uncharacterized protein n=1 Tax=Ancylostoma ceylanicum TaxID=53326 RepID=A0A016U7Y9_9BILA|nr:hypothetical protein Y032_0050g1908 [Ancylostoma ceylanicum]